MSRYIVTTKHHAPDEPLHVVILAGSLGYREKSRGPKVLQIHEGVSVLEHQARTILHVYPRAHISVTAGFQADKVIRFRPDYVSVIENQLWETHNTVEEARLYLNSVNAKRVMFIDGAILFTNHAINMANQSSILCENDSLSSEVGVYTEDDRVINFSYGLDKKWSGILYLQDRDLMEFKRVCTRENSKLCIFEILNMLLDKKINLKAVTLEKKETARI